MKPPTKDWSSEHQSSSCKSSLFQTSGVLIQTPPRRELLVRNQYSSWGGGQRLEQSEKYLLMKGLKSLSSPSSIDLPGGPLMQLSKVHNGFIIPMLHWRALHQNSSFHFRKKKKKSIKDLKEAQCFQLGWEWSVEIWQTNTQTASSLQPIQQRPYGPSPCPANLQNILVQVPLWHPAVLRSWFHLPLPFFLALTCFRPWIRINSFHTELWYHVVFLLMPTAFGN